MRICLYLLALAFASFNVVSSKVALNVDGIMKCNESAAALDFVSFKKHFHRTYDVSSEQCQHRYANFKNATERHKRLNSFSTGSQSAKYGINQFADLSQKEFREIYLRAFSEKTTSSFRGRPTGPLPVHFDWRDKAVVAPVQDQLDCGSCWAFSVVGAIQSVHTMGGSHPLQQLSVQQLMDCSSQNDGCAGGSPFLALRWLKQTGVKLVTQRENPYQATAGTCRFFNESHGVVAVKNFSVHSFSGQEEAMMGQLVRRGPLVAVVDAVSWQDYLGGVVQHHCSSQWANHAVLIVGYDTTESIPHWIVQNSWGASWGNEGYVYIKIGGNICGIADSVAAVFL